MRYTATFTSPLGEMLLASDGQALTGLWFQGQRYDAAGLAPDARPRSDLPILQQARDWLGAYFAGEHLVEQPFVAPSGTPFQQAVWAELQGIPYGATTTYGELARRIGERRGVHHV